MCRGRLFRFSGLVAALALATAAFLVQAAELPPRTIADVAQLLDQYRPDVALLERSRKDAQAEPPSGISKSELAAFLVKRSLAAESLGLTQRLLDDRRKLAEMHKGDHDEAQFLMDLAATEGLSGNWVTALRLMNLVVDMPRGRPGHDIAASAFVSRALSFLGDFDGARKSMADTQVLTRRYSQFANRARGFELWNAVIEWARADALYAEGKLTLAEVALRKALEHAALDVREAADRHRSMSGLSRDISHAMHDLIQSRLAAILVRQGKLADAELTARNMIRRNLQRVGRYAPPTGIAATTLSEVLAAQDRFAEAQIIAERAVDIMEQASVDRSASVQYFARRALTDALVGRERWIEAVRQIDGMLTASESEPALAHRAVGSAAWGIALVKVGRATDAVSMMTRIVDRAVRFFGSDQYETAEARGILAMALAAAGKRGDALAEFREAMRVLLGAPRGDESTSQGLRRIKFRHIVEAYIDALTDPRNAEALRESGVDPIAAAFRISDATRTGTLQQALTASAARAAVTQPGLGDLIRREQDAGRDLAAAFDLLLRLMSTPPKEQKPEVIEQARVRVTALEQERSRTYSAIEKSYPDYANLINPKPPALAEAQRLLRTGEALVSIVCGDEWTFVVAANAAGRSGMHRAALPKAELRRAVSILRRSLDVGDTGLARIPRFDLELAHSLYARLLAPLQDLLLDARTLIVSVDGALAEIPLAILPADPPQQRSADGSDELNSVSWLARRSAIVSVPTFGTFVRLRQLPQGRNERLPFVGFGDPDFGARVAAGTGAESRLRSLRITRTSDQDGFGTDVPWTAYDQLTPLPDTRLELQAIAQALGADERRDVFLGQRASRSNVLSTDLYSRRVVAFATHGLVPGDLPGLAQPALALSLMSDPKQSPLLSLDDVLTLKLDADWVVLSACNTAAADGQGAEAVSGLGRGFFYAGSRALLVTHWPVETVSARRLVAGIFERYGKDPALSRAQALNAAMLAVMALRDPTGGTPYSHPLYWAPYALIGDGGR